MKHGVCVCVCVCVCVVCAVLCTVIVIIYSVTCGLLVQGPDDFVLSASSAAQRKLLQSLDVLENALLCVEGPHRIWIKKTEQLYYSVTLLPWQTDDSRQSGEGDPNQCVWV